MSETTQVPKAQHFRPDDIHADAAAPDRKPSGDRRALHRFALSGGEWPRAGDLPKVRKAVLVADVVESVRLFEEAEEDVVRRWRTFVREAVWFDARPHGGRLVKSLGDGLLFAFDLPIDAVRCAAAMHDRLRESDTGRPPQRRILLRIGLHLADVFMDELDLYGIGVNLAARLSALARPGETIVSEAIRDAFSSTQARRFECMGERHLKHVAKPVRAYRVLSMPEPAAKGGTPPSHRWTVADSCASYVKIHGRYAPSSLNAEIA